MKNLIFVLALMVGALGADAQMVGTNDIRTVEAGYVTATVHAGFGGKLQAALDWGQDVEKSKEFVLVDENGKKIIFRRYVQLLNMMSEWGWEFVQLTDNELDNNVQNWLFRRVAEK